MVEGFHLSYPHRHGYKFVSRLGPRYLFICVDCDAHGLNAWRSISYDQFWHGKSKE